MIGFSHGAYLPSGVTMLMATPAAKAAAVAIALAGAASAPGRPLVDCVVDDSKSLSSSSSAKAGRAQEKSSNSDNKAAETVTIAEGLSLLGIAHIKCLSIRDLRDFYAALLALRCR